MRIQLASDLHLVFLEGQCLNVRLVEPAPDADLAMLAAGTHNGVKTIEAIADWPAPKEGDQAAATIALG